MSQQTGRVTVKVAGAALSSSAGGASIQVGGPEREDSLSDQGEYFYKEKLIPSEIKATLKHCVSLDVIALRKAKNVPVTFVCDDGTVYTVADAVCKSVGEVKSDGEVEVVFGGPPAVKA